MKQKSEELAAVVQASTKQSSSPSGKSKEALLRLCVSCRTFKPREELIRLTVETSSGQVRINTGEPPVHGRSAYLCRSQACLTQALKGRLKGALEGRKAKNLENRRSIKWPLEPQIIQTLSSRCTEPGKT